MQTNVNVSARVEQNRLETAKLLRKRLVQAHRKGQSAARKRIVIRQAIRIARNALLVLLVGSAVVTAGFYLNLIPAVEIQIKGANAPAPAAPAPAVPAALVLPPQYLPPPTTPAPVATPEASVQDVSPQLQLDFEMKPRTPNFPDSTSKPNLQ